MAGKEGALPLLAGWKGKKADFALKGHKAIVTGGTKGIGKAICESLAAEGVDIALCSRKQEEVDAMVTSLQSEFGIKAYGAALDVADGEALKAWVTSMGEKLGGIDVVVSNVSALNGGDDEAIYKACYELDLMGAVRMRQAAMPFFEKSANPSFIAISSVSGLETDGFFEGYGCMKAALNFWIKGSARKYADKGIRFNVVCPGNVYFDGGVWGNAEKGAPDFFKSVLAMNPTGRMSTPQEQAAAVVFFASPISAFCTGSSLLVDGAISRLAP